MKQLEIGKRFGKLVIIGKSEKILGRNRLYICKCDCGNIVEVSSAKLGRYTNSCGCIKKERAKQLCADNEKTHNRNQLGYFEGSQLTQIKSKKPYSTNKLGVRGVYYEKRSGKYIAKITVKGKNIVLGYFSKLEDAIKARKNGEENYFKPIIERSENND